MRRSSGFAIVFAVLILSTFSSAQEPLPLPDVPRDSRSTPANQTRYLPDTTFADPDGSYDGDHFGTAVDTDGDWMIAGAPDDDNAGAANSRRGSISFLKRNGATGAWARVSEIASFIDQQYFGTSVSIWDNGTFGLAVVGAPGTTVSAQNAAGQVMVFSRSGDVWTLEDTLTAPTPEENARFGESVAISETKVVIGAGSDRQGGTDMGAAYVFRRQSSPSIDWVFEQKITPADGASGDLFGAAVAINREHGNRILVGAPGNDVGGADSGAAYLYDFNGSQWVADGPRIDTPYGAAGDKFGASVALAHSDFDAGAAYFAIGMPGHNSNTGAVTYYYRSFDDDTIPMPLVLTPADGASGDFFGASVDVAPFGYGVLVGAEEDSTGALADAGSVYHYRFLSLGVAPILAGKYIASLAENGDKFGTAVVFDNEGGFLAGAPFDSNGLGTETGAIYQVRPAVLYGMFGPQVDEGGFDSNLFISLASRPSAVVEVTLTPETECAVGLFGGAVGSPGAPMILYFATTAGGPSGWDTSRNVILSAVDDTLNEGTHYCLLTATVFTTDEAYAALPPITVYATIFDNDAEEILANTSFEPAPRAGSLAPWTLANKSGDKVVCGVAAADGACAFMFKGGAGEKAKLTYKVSSYAFERMYGDAATFSLRVQRTGANGKLGIKIKVKYADGTDTQASKTIKPFDGPFYESYELSPISMGDPFADPPPVITVTITHKSTNGKTYIDDVSLAMSRNAFIFNRAPAAPPPAVPDGFRR